MQRMATYVGCKEKGQELKKAREAASGFSTLARLASSLGAQKVAANLLSCFCTSTALHHVCRRFEL